MSDGEHVETGSLLEVDQEVIEHIVIIFLYNQLAIIQLLLHYNYSFSFITLMRN